MGWCCESVRGWIYCISFWQRWNGLISVSSFPNSCLRTWDLQTESERGMKRGSQREIKKKKFTIREKLSNLFLYLLVHTSCSLPDILLFTFLIKFSGLTKNYFREIVLYFVSKYSNFLHLEKAFLFWPMSLVLILAWNTLFLRSNQVPKKKSNLAVFLLLISNFN